MPLTSKFVFVALPFCVCSPCCCPSLRAVPIVLRSLKIYTSECMLSCLLSSVILFRIAIALRIFKVETIGDSYMAVSGLPEPDDNHAINMARFAYQCVQCMNKVTEDLESVLGPGTSALTIRYVFICDAYGCSRFAVCYWAPHVEIAFFSSSFHFQLWYAFGCRYWRCTFRTTAGIDLRCLFVHCQISSLLLCLRRFYAGMILCLLDCFGELSFVLRRVLTLLPFSCRQKSRFQLYVSVVRGMSS